MPVHKTDHWKINNDFHNNNTPPLARTLEETCEMSKQSKENYRCDKQPLLNIPLDNVVVDELPLMLSVRYLDWKSRDSKKGAGTELLQKASLG